MGRIQNKNKYPIKGNPVPEDYLVGTDSEDGGKTVSFLVSSISSDGNTVDDNNKVVLIDFGNAETLVDDERSSVATSINTSPFITVEYDEIPVFKGIVSYTNGNPALSYLCTFVIQNRGKGDYGVGGTAVTASDLVRVSREVISEFPDLLSDVNAVVVDLGDIGTNQIEDVVNVSNPPIVVGVGENYYFEYNRSGARFLYGFSGTVGTYGLGESQTVADDYFLVYDEAIPTTVTKTSELINDGDSGDSSFVEFDVLGDVALSDDYNDLINTPTIPPTVDQTSDITNDGADGTSTYVETDELGATAFDNDYNSLDNLPTITDENVKVSPNDNTAGSLLAKLVAGTNISLVEVNDGGNETLRIDVSSSTGLPITQKTGTNIVFTEDAFYNETTPLTSGTLTLDLTGAVIGATTIVYVDRYIPTISGADYLITGVIDNSKLNLLWMTYDGQRVNVTVVPKSYLINPNFVIEEGVTSNNLSGINVPNGLSYEMYVNEVENTYADQATMFADQGNQTSGKVNYVTADTAYYEYLGTVIGDITDYLLVDENEIGSAVLEVGYDGASNTYNDTGLTTDTSYIYFVRASGNGFLQSFYGSNVGTPAFGNTLIGGMATTYPTESDLATFLGITDDDIDNYIIYNGTDISCNITTNYTLPANAFLNNNDITFYSDIQGQCNAVTSGGHFQNADSLLYVDMRGTFAQAPNVALSALVEYANFPNATAGDIVCNRNPQMKWFYYPNADGVAGSYAMADMESVESIYQPNAAGAWGANTFRDTSNKIILEFPLITDATGGSSLYFVTNANTKVILEGATTFGSGQMCRSFGGTIVIPNVSTNIGGVVTNATTFLNCAATTTVYAHNNLATNNGGGIDGDLAYVQAQGGTVIFITDSTPPSAVNDLGTSSITANSVDLTFTTPASTNLYDHLDVYIDKGEGAGYRLLDEAILTGDTISNLPSATEIKIKVKSVDEFYNRSGFSNEVIFTTL